MWVVKFFQKWTRRFFPKQHVAAKLFLIFLLPMGCLSPIFASEVFIPSQLGQVRDKVEGSRGRTVVIIEEAHVAYHAQKVLAEILEDLIRHESFRHVFVEGGWGDVSLTGLRHLASGDKRREVGERYLREGKISGEEYLSLTTDLEMNLWGVEDPGLYATNMKAFLQLSPEQPRLEEEISRIKSGLVRLGSDILTETQTRILSMRREYESKKGSLLDYVKFLMGHLSDVSGQYPNLTSLLGFAGGSDVYDAEKVSLEKQSAVRFLSRWLTKPELEALLLLDGQGSMEQEIVFLDELLGKINEYSMSPGVPNVDNLENYRNAIKEASRMDTGKLFEELEMAAEDVFMAQMPTVQQQTFFKIFQGVSTLEKLISLRLTEDEFLPLAKEKEPFSLREWNEFLSGLTNGGIFFLSPEDGFRFLEPWIPVAVEFYQSARAREQAMVENLVREMDVRSLDRAILVAGGFHSRNFLKALKEQDFTVLLVSPKFTPGDEGAMHEKYLKILKDKWIGATKLGARSSDFETDPGNRRANVLNSEGSIF
ncbi:MAG: hypothetical protein BWY44_00034 [Candidatus Omnitrophica bacterium ADurb.Bin292]|jgi:hypothetical protein|nr:MAG: hypothetical protein BWY44_00034 [Candidatus Omnitrophica bacterium ADurb.Bin292]